METGEMIRRRIRQFIARRCWDMCDLCRAAARWFERLGDRAWEPKNHG